MKGVARAGSIPPIEHEQEASPLSSTRSKYSPAEHEQEVRGITAPIHDAIPPHERPWVTQRNDTTTGITVPDDANNCAEDDAAACAWRDRGRGRGGVPGRMMRVLLPLPDRPSPDAVMLAVALGALLLLPPVVALPVLPLPLLALVALVVALLLVVVVPGVATSAVAGVDAVPGLGNKNAPGAVAAVVAGADAD